MLWFELNIGCHYGKYFGGAAVRRNKLIKVQQKNVTQNNWFKQKLRN